MLLEMIGIAIFAGAAIKDSVNNQIEISEDKQKAHTTGRPYYWDSKGRMFSMRTGEQVSTHTEFHVYDPATKRYRARNCIKRVKDYKFVDWIGPFYDPKW